MFKVGDKVLFQSPSGMENTTYSHLEGQIVLVIRDTRTSYSGHSFTYIRYSGKSYEVYTWRLQKIRDVQITIRRRECLK